MNRLDRRNSIFISIDVQEKLLPVIHNKDEIIKNQNILFKIAKELKIPVIVTEQYPKGLGPTVEGIIDEESDYKILEKQTFGPPENLLGILRETNRKQLIIAGIEMHICMYQTARDLINLGYEVTVVGDASGSRTEKNDQNGRELLKSAGAVVSNTESVLFDLLGEAGTPEFKALSPLIK